MADTITFEITGEDGSTDEVTIPAPMLELLIEDDEGAATVVGDLALFGCAERIHGALHHGQGDPDPELESIEAATMAQFEERFGATFGELTGHQH